MSSKKMVLKFSSHVWVYNFFRCLLALYMGRKFPSSSFLFYRRVLLFLLQLLFSILVLVLVSLLSTSCVPTHDLTLILITRWLEFSFWKIKRLTFRYQMTIKAEKQHHNFSMNHPLLKRTCYCRQIWRHTDNFVWIENIPMNHPSVVRPWSGS